MNTYDLKIIKHLMTNARTTWAELGGILGMSAPAAAERVRKLEDRRIIKGYAALIDPEAAGCPLAAYIAVTLERPQHRAAFLETVAQKPEIMECHHIAGDEDYILKVRCTGTRDLENLISEDIKSMEGVAKTKTTIILSTIKETPVLPLSAERE